MKKSFIRQILALGFVTALLAACGGGGSVGDACAKELDANECASGALCAKTSTGMLQCQQVCVAQADCPANTNCNGTSGTQKVCQPK